MASAPDGVLEARRDVLVEALMSAPRFALSGLRSSLEPVAGTAESPAGEDLKSLVWGELARCWEPAAEVLKAMAPDLVIVADYRQAGAVAAIDRAWPGVHVIVAPLGPDPGAVGLSAFSGLFDRSASSVVFTERERRAVEGVVNAKVRNVGLPMSANRSLLREPNAYLGEREYILVLTGSREQSSEPSASLARLLRARFARRNVAVSASDSFTVSLNGIADKPEPVERGSDLVRLIAWARVTVDLRPGRLFARRCLESLLYSTPIVVPSQCSAREHAEAGGGLWFEGPSDLSYCVETLLDPEVSETLGEQGRAYAERNYGSTEAFIENVVSASGLGAAAALGPRAD